MQFQPCRQAALSCLVVHRLVFLLFVSFKKKKKKHIPGPSISPRAFPPEPLDDMWVKPADFCSSCVSTSSPFLSFERYGARFLYTALRTRLASSPLLFEDLARRQEDCACIHTTIPWRYHSISDSECPVSTSVGLDWNLYAILRRGPRKHEVERAPNSAI